MASLNDFIVTDDVTDNLASLHNRLLGGSIRAEFVNTETISGTKELDDNDCQFQVLTAGSTDQTVELSPEADTNHLTVIYNTTPSSDGYNLTVKDDSGTSTFATLDSDEWAMFLPVYGEGWKMIYSGDIGTGLFERLTELTEDSTPNGAADYGVTYDASASAAKKVLMRFFGTREWVAGFSNDNPADSTTYYFGNFWTATLAVSATNRRLYALQAGKIIAADIFMTFSNGSNETSTMSIRKNDTTDTTLSSAIALNSTPYHEQVTGLDIDLAAGDYIEIKWVTPAWATNPTSVYCWIKLLIA